MKHISRGIMPAAALAIALAACGTTGSGGTTSTSHTTRCSQDDAGVDAMVQSSLGDLAQNGITNVTADQQRAALLKVLPQDGYDGYDCASFLAGLVVTEESGG
jgi:hypothetical protein